MMAMFVRLPFVLIHQMLIRSRTISISTVIGFADCSATCTGVGFS